MTRFSRLLRTSALMLGIGAILALTLTAMLAPTAQAVGERAVAELYNAENQLVGLAFFEQISQSTVRITGPVEGLSRGPHGVHIHETGTCEPPDFTSAGGHVNPTGAAHGLEDPDGPHAGDLRNLSVPEDGRAWLEFETDRISLTDGPTSLFDADGSAIVIHAGADDQRTDPSGDSGARVVCGEITRAESVESMPPGDDDRATVSEQQPSESQSSGFPSLGLAEVIILALVGVGLFFLLRIVL